MTTTALTIETAPRDLEALKKIGRFNLRTLANLLGIFESEAAKTSFMQATNDQQSDTIFKLLQERDGVGKASGKGGGAATGRSPSTKNAGKAATGAAGAGKAAGSAAAGSGGAQGAGAGAEAILKAINELRDEYSGLRESIDNLTASVTALQSISAGTNRFVALSIGLSGKLAEQVLQAPLDQVLEAVVEDMSTVEAAMKNMGPAAEDEAEDEGDEEGEGNEEE